MRTIGPGKFPVWASAIYQKKIKHLVEPQENGKFIVIDVESGDYEIDEQDVVASSRLRERRPNAVTYGVLIGYRVAYSLGGRIEATDESGQGHLSEKVNPRRLARRRHCDLNEASVRRIDLWGA